MRWVAIILFCAMALTARLALGGTFPLTDGTKITGEAVSINEYGVQFKPEDGTSPPRTAWAELTPEALKELMAEAKTDHDRELIEPMLENQPQEVKATEIVVKPIEEPARPSRNLGLTAMFGSPVGLFLLLVLYGANIFAAYEVAIYRHQAKQTVCGLAAIPLLGVLSPIIYIAMPPKIVAEESPVVMEQPAEAAAAESAGEEPASPTSPARERRPLAMPGATNAAGPGGAPAAAMPDAVVFARGEYSFNRRFFETKFAGFFRLIPTEAEKDLVLLFKTQRGDFIGRRITRITPSELDLQVFHGEATADEMIPFTEIMEVQIRHKDSF
jgi:hypothetical protein